jgi:tetratricopeptide (TPR) repeat protein
MPLDTPTESPYASDVTTLKSFTLALALSVGLLHAQAPDTPQPDPHPEIAAVIQAATAAKNPETLEEQAAKLEARGLYDSAEKLLTAALALREQISGDQSAEYGLCLLKLGTLEHKLIHTKESADYYARAVRLLPGRPEAAQAAVRQTDEPHRLFSLALEQYICHRRNREIVKRLNRVYADEPSEAERPVISEMKAKFRSTIEDVW